MKKFATTALAGLAVLTLSGCQTDYEAEPIPVGDCFVLKSSDNGGWSFDTLGVYCAADLEEK